MNSLLEKAISEKEIKDEDIADALCEICDVEHSSCNSNCPVYYKNGGKPLGCKKPFKENRGCDCFQNGFAMLKFLRS